VQISASFASRVIFVARIPSAKEIIAVPASEGEVSVALTGPNKLLSLVPTFHPCQKSADPVTIAFHVCLLLILRSSSPEITTQKYHFIVRIRQSSATIAKVPKYPIARKEGSMGIIDADLSKERIVTGEREGEISLTDPRPMSTRKPSSRVGSSMRSVVEKTQSEQCQVC
jgi:hypothetical protein